MCKITNKFANVQLFVNLLAKNFVISILLPNFAYQKLVNKLILLIT